MITLLAAAAVTPYYFASGFPMADAAGKDVTVQGHNVTIAVSRKTAEINTMTLLKNNLDKPVTVMVTIPRMSTGTAQDDLRAFDLTAQWDKTPLVLTAANVNNQSRQAQSDSGSVVMQRPLTCSVTFEAHGTHAIRINYTTALGQTGYERKQRLLVYGLTGAGSWGSSVAQMNIAFNYTQKDVFNLPEISPKWDWQVGQRGAFIRLENYVPKPNEEAVFTFYSSGFGG